MKYESRFQRAADAAARDDTFQAVKALFGTDLDSHEPINGDITVGDVRDCLDGTQVEALGLDGEQHDADIIGYSTDNGFELKTATTVEMTGLSTPEGHKSR